MKCLFFGLLLCSLAVNAQQMKEYNIENEAVSYYRSHSTSTFSPIEGNVKQDFFDAARPYRADWPQPVVIDIDTEDTFSGDALVTLSLQKDMKHPASTTAVTLSKGKGKVQFVNLIPGRTYYYQIKTTDGKLVVADSFRTTGQVRMIATEKGFNIRDLGGWKGLDGMTVRYGWLYRGGSLGGTDKPAKASPIAIDARDLDWFIKHMLGMKQKQYAPHAPSWRFKGDKLNAIIQSN